MLERQDYVWKPSLNVILLLSLACGLSAVLASYIHFEDREGMVRVFSVMEESMSEFVLVGLFFGQVLEEIWGKYR